MAIGAARGSRLSRMPKALVAGIAALVAVLLAIVILIVTSSGAVVASALLRKLRHRHNRHPGRGHAYLHRSIWQRRFLRKWLGVGAADSNATSASFSGTFGGTAFALTSTEETSFAPGATTVPDIEFAVSGNYGSLPVRGTLTWKSHPLTRKPDSR